MQIDWTKVLIGAVVIGVAIYLFTKGGDPLPPSEPPKTDQDAEISKTEIKGKNIINKEKTSSLTAAKEKDEDLSKADHKTNKESSLLAKEKDEDLSKPDLQTNKESLLHAKENTSTKNSSLTTATDKDEDSDSDLGDEITVEDIQISIRELKIYSPILKKVVDNDVELLLHSVSVYNPGKSLDYILIITRNLSVDDQNKYIRTFIIDNDIKFNES